MARLISDVGLNYLRANIDLGHLNLMHTKPKDLKALENLIAHVHISDNNGLVDGNDLIGTGTTPIRKYLEAVIDFGFLTTAKMFGSDAVTSIEVGNIGQKVGNIDRDVQDPDQIAQKCIDYLRSEVPFLA